MKKILIKFLALGAIGLFVLPACKKNDALVTSTGAKAGVLTASTTTLSLDKTKLNDTTDVITFSFTAPQYSFPAAVTNTLQIDSAGDNWANPTSVTLGTKVSSLSYNTADFNTLLLKKVPAGKASQINIRVQHTLSTTVSSYSNVVSMTVTPFNLTSWVYAVGSFQGWNINQQDSLVSATGNNIYVGILNFTAGNRDFLITPKKGSYDNKYSTNDPINTTSSTVTQNAPNNFYAPTAAGQYIVTLNLNTNTITFAAADYYSIIGSAALGWDTGDDTPMKYINDGTGTWVANNVPMTVGEYKFRQDDQWTNSWGPGAATGSAVSSGATGDGNFQLTVAGNYNLTFVMPASVYGSTPLSTTTYTAVKK